MPKNSAEVLNRHHAEFVADPIGHKEQFWSVVHAYVQRCCYLIPAEFKDDLVQDIILEVMNDIDRFRSGTNFQKWLSAIIRNLRADSFRANLYQRREIPFSQLGTWEEDGNYVEFEPSSLNCSVGDEDLMADLPSPQRILTAAAKLDAVRANLKRPPDLQLFDCLRSGLSLAQAAMRLGITYSAAQRRFARWKIKLTGKCLKASAVKIEITEPHKRAA